MAHNLNLHFEVLDHGAHWLTPQVAPDKHADTDVYQSESAYIDAAGNTIKLTLHWLDGKPSQENEESVEVMILQRLKTERRI